MHRRLVFVVALVTAFGIASCSGPANEDADDRALTATMTPTETVTATKSPTPTGTSTSSPTATLSPVPLPTETAVPSPTATPAPSPTPSPTPDPAPFAVAFVELNDIDDSPLRYLSLAPHPFLGGATYVHGTLSLSGTGQPVSVVLEVLEEGTVIATGVLSDTAAEILLQPLDGGSREISVSQELFVFTPEQLAAVDSTRTTDAQLDLRVRATRDDGREAVADAGTAELLVRYTNENRYFIGEEWQGGNDWVLPSVRALLEGFEGVEFGDISNMNGGQFPPHVSHQQGRDADVWFFGYNDLDGDAARTLVALVDDPAIVSRVEVIFVTYERVAGDPFWDALDGVVLSDGRPAGAVIQPEPDHTGHFHIRFYS